MSSPQWLPLNDYSNKYKISISTLRRRIKADDISFQLNDGKYFIIDEPMSTHQKHRPSLNSEVDLVGAHRSEPILSAANKLLKELKAAYTQVLQEKEEQILKLKEEISDLKTLVKLLEKQNSNTWDS